MADKNTDEKLASLRAQFQEHGINGYMIPRADEWQGQYVPERADRLAWLTGFKGSVGQAIVTADKAILHSNKIYTEQIKIELDDKYFDSESSKPVSEAPNEWLLENAPEGTKIGYDPRLHTVKEIEDGRKILAKKNIMLVPINGNLVDAIWDDQPEHPMDKVIVYPEKFAGQSSADKISEIVADLHKEDAEAVLLTAPDSIAWLLNIRGTDIPHTPLVLSYALVCKAGDVSWFIPSADEKVTEDVRRHVGEDVYIYDFEEMPEFLKKLAPNNKILMDEGLSSISFKTLLEDAGANVQHMDDPTVARKAIKNESEIKGITEAHVQDGVALVKFWKWIDENAQNGGYTELDAVAKLRGFREEREGFRDDSFDTIMGWAGNGAIVHYDVDEGSNKEITENSLLLCDSGGQYLSDEGTDDYAAGTTDNTGMRAVGTPTDIMVENSTRVLKGHIAIASAHLEEATTSPEFDMLARQFLRKVGLDYGHGTGHGVGAYSTVHEDGAGIRPSFEGTFKAGMLVSNEPGFYDKKAGYGIRHERLMFVEETGDDKLKYKFNTVSLTPFDQKLIDIDLLDSDEIKWLNEYHKKVYDNLAPHLDKGEKEWLQKETAPLKPSFVP